MGWTGIYEKLVQFATEKIWIIMFFWISSGFVTFAPERWLSAFKLSGLPMTINGFIGLTAIFASLNHIKYRIQVLLRALKVVYKQPLAWYQSQMIDLE